MSEYTPKDASNKGGLMGQKQPYKSQEIWAIRVRLQIDVQVRVMALSNLGRSACIRRSTARTRCGAPR
jgi:hypothetical protein